MAKIRLIIADDYPIVREGLKSIFSAAPDIDVLADAKDSDEALALTIKLLPDILMLDMALPGGSTHQLIKQVKRWVPQTSVLVISMYREEHHAALALRAGANGYISKKRTPSELIEATRQVAKGQVYISRELARQVALNTFSGRSLNTPHEQLSPREHEVLIKLARGLGVSQIAMSLHLSPKTISTHKTRIFKKLALGSTSELVRYAIDHELL